MSSKEEKYLTTKYTRTLKNMKKSNTKNIILIFIMLLCMTLLILNNLRTYSACDMLAYQLKEIKKKQVEEKVVFKQDNIKPAVPQADTKSAEKLNKLLAENEYLKKINENIAQDNISLQNSLKIAAMAGVKPKNYTRPPVITSRSMHERWQYIGKFKGTAYTPSVSECGNNKGITSSGKPIVPGTTIAVDTKYWPIGTVFYVKGIGCVTAMDTGNAVKGKKRFDFAVFDKKFAYALGTRYWDVYLVKMGSGKVK
ncbi:MAG: 3D domain-containing protein [Deltaproteobacteria bacterium]